MIRRRSTPLDSFYSRCTTRHSTPLLRIHAGNAANPFLSCRYFITSGHPGGGVTPPAHRSIVTKSGCPTEIQCLNSSFSYSSALFCTARSRISFSFNSFRTLYLKHPGWGSPSASANSVPSALKSTRSFTPCDPFETHHRRVAAISFIFRTSAKHVRNSRGLCTFKTQDLKPFLMSSYEKTREGEAPLQSFLLAVSCLRL